MVIKPAEETPATGLALARALVDAGLPPGVLSVVFGDPAAVSARLIRSPHIRKVTFTGSTAVGRQIAALAAEGVKRVTLELGGHAPVLVFADADLGKAARLAAGAKFRNAGQICIAPTRFLVQEPVLAEFTTRFAAEIGQLRLGDGLDPETTLGPLAHDRRPPAIAALVDDAVARGAEVVTGGGPAAREGYFWRPTLLSGVEPQARVMNEEPFGPVAVTARVHRHARTRWRRLTGCPTAWRRTRSPPTGPRPTRCPRASRRACSPSTTSCSPPPKRRSAA